MRSPEHREIKEIGESTLIVLSLISPIFLCSFHHYYVFGLNGVGSGGAVRGEPDFTHAL